MTTCPGRSSSRPVTRNKVGHKEITKKEDVWKTYDAPALIITECAQKFLYFGPIYDLATWFMLYKSTMYWTFPTFHPSNCPAFCIVSIYFINLICSNSKDRWESILCGASGQIFVKKGCECFLKYLAILYRLQLKCYWVVSDMSKTSYADFRRIHINSPANCIFSEVMARRM